jgi:hypothetical protein
MQMDEIPECYCDSPLCEKSWVCARLGKLRIAYAILEEFRPGGDLPQALYGYDLETTKGMLERIEWECEALCK